MQNTLAEPNDEEESETEASSWYGFSDRPEEADHSTSRSNGNSGNLQEESSEGQLQNAHTNGSQGNIRSKNFRDIRHRETYEQQAGHQRESDVETMRMAEMRSKNRLTSSKPVSDARGTSK